MLRLLFHPLFVFGLIAYLSCIRGTQDEEILYEMPQAGDNFKVAGFADVYYFSGSVKYAYESQACFFSFNNPPFNTHYRNGGIKCIAADIAESIPLGGAMCGAKKITFIERQPTFGRYFSFAFWLNGYSGLGHLFWYFLLAWSILRYFSSFPSRYMLAFGLALLGGILLEVVQGLFIPGRTASFSDAFFDALGAGLAVGWGWLRNLSQ